MDIPTPLTLPLLGLCFWFWSKIPIVFGLLVVEHIYMLCSLDAAAVGMEIAGRWVTPLSLGISHSRPPFPDLAAPSSPGREDRVGAVVSLVALRNLRVQLLLQQNAELLAQGLELVKVLLVLLLVLDLGLDACFEDGRLAKQRRQASPAWGWNSGRTLEDPHGSGEVVDPPGGLERGGAHAGGGDEVIGKGVVQVALRVVWVSAASSSAGRAAPQLGFSLPGAQRRPGRCRTPSRICSLPSARQRIDLEGSSVWTQLTSIGPPRWPRRDMG